jgi:hypothetical protein
MLVYVRQPAARKTHGRGSGESAAGAAARTRNMMRCGICLRRDSGIFSYN